jgi:hypothetical protein
MALLARNDSDRYRRAGLLTPAALMPNDPPKLSPLELARQRAVIDALLMRRLRGIERRCSVAGDERRRSGNSQGAGNETEIEASCTAKTSLPAIAASRQSAGVFTGCAGRRGLSII